jgi:uncharacterized protein YndB with AHSA1/START domain
VPRYYRCRGQRANSSTRQLVEHASDGVHGFEGRYREVSPPEKYVRTFEWDGMPG